MQLQWSESIEILVLLTVFKTLAALFEYLNNT